jgi:hypothetical protein
MVPFPFALRIWRSVILARAAAANENPAIGLGIFYGVTDEISEDAIEQYRIAHDGRASGAHTDVNPLLQRSPQQLIEQPIEVFDCMLV